MQEKKYDGRCDVANYPSNIRTELRVSCGKAPKEQDNVAFAGSNKESHKGAEEIAFISCVVT